MGHYDEFGNPLDAHNHISCGSKHVRGCHDDVVFDCYSDSGCLIGEHWRCKTCGAWWYKGAGLMELPDEPTTWLPMKKGFS
jgi:hypothetical protein